MVELRTQTHLNSQMHYIRAIKDGSIKIVMNRDARGKSKLKFRQLVDVYNGEKIQDDDDDDDDDDVVIPIVVRDLEDVSDIGAEVDIKTTDQEDFTMTLEKVRKQCKEKKRKLRNCSSRDTETATSVEVNKEGLTQDEGCDFEEPLSNWDTKFSKRRKKKRECDSTSSPSVAKVYLPSFCDIKPEAGDDSYSVSEAMDFFPTDPLLDCDNELEFYINLVVEEEEVRHDSSEDTRLAPCRIEEPNSPGMVAIEEPNSPGMIAIEESIEPVEKVFEDASEEPNSPGMVAIEEPIEPVEKVFQDASEEPIEPVEKVFEDASEEPIKAVEKVSEAWDDSYSVSEAMDFVHTEPLLDCNNESQSPINTVLGEEVMHDSSEDMRLALCCIEEPNSPGMVTVEEPNSPGMIAIEEPIELVGKAFEDASEEFNDAKTKEQCCLADDVSLENKEIILYGSVSTEEMELDVQQHSESENTDSFNPSSGVEEVKEVEESSDSTCLEIVKVEAPEIVAVDYSSFSSMDFGVENTEIVWETEDISKDGPLRQPADILDLTYCCNSLDYLQPLLDDSTISLEEDQVPERLQQPSSSKEEDEAEYQRLSQLYSAHAFQKSAETNSIQQQKLHQQPEKLLSGRKAISPNSQAKLRKAMEQPESLEKRNKKSKGKLYFSSQNTHRFLKAQGLDNIDRVEIIPSSKQAIQKVNNSSRQTQNQRASRKFPRTRAAKTQPFSTGRTSMQECSQKAVSFSQGQMLDFRHVAYKLTKELRTMRQLTKRCLLPETNTSDCNLDEVKTLIKNAEKTEERSKKWLSMIERNSNRFCKLMGLVKEDSPATENLVQKKRKIRFADDAGGELCQVKVFEIDLESES